MPEEVSGEVCWIHIGEDSVEIKTKYPFKEENFLATPEVFLEKDELDKFPILRCNEIYITTSSIDYYRRKKHMRFVKKVLSKIEQNWIERKTRPAPLFYPPEELEKELKKVKPTLVKRTRF